MTLHMNLPYLANPSFPTSPLSVLRNARNWYERLGRHGVESSTELFLAIEQGPGQTNHTYCFRYWTKDVVVPNFKA
jgi:hypothetical protein